MSLDAQSLAENKNMTVVCGVTGEVLQKGTADLINPSTDPNYTELPSLQASSAFRQLLAQQRPVSAN